MLLDARAAVETLAHVLAGAARRSSDPARQRSCSAASASRIAVDVVRGDDDAGARPRGSASAAAPSGGTTARIGRSAARYSKTLPESTPRPRPPASGISSSSASESRCSSSARRCGAYGMQLEPVAEPERLGPLAVGRAEVADEAGDDVQLRRRRAPAGTAAGRACRRTMPACVIRNRSPRRYSSPAKSSKSQPFAIVDDRAPRLERARLLGDRVGDGDDRVRRARDERARPPARGLLLRAHGELLGAPVRVRDDRVAQVGDPAHAGRALDRGADEVDRVRRRGRDHDVDPLAA